MYKIAVPGQKRFFWEMELDMVSSWLLRSLHGSLLDVHGQYKIYMTTFQYAPHVDPVTAT